MSKDSGPSSRRIWRMSARAPLDEIVEVELSNSGERQRLESDEYLGTDWHGSSFDLLSGCQVRDYTGRIPVRVFNALFKD